MSPMPCPWMAHRYLSSTNIRRVRVPHDIYGGILASFHMTRDYVAMILSLIELTSSLYGLND